MPSPSKNRTSRWLLLAGALAQAAVLLVPIEEAEATPAFARRYEMTCSSCHQYHYPRLNSFGRRFRENGYQLPEGAEDQARARRNVAPGAPDDKLRVFREVPLSLRGQAFGIVRAHSDGETDAIYDNSLFSFIIGGGTVAKDVSYFFSWTPFPDADIHQARVGIHNIAKSTLGEGTLNIRAGALFLLDFQRPGHRFLANAPTSATSVTVGLNRFNLDDSTLGVQAYGRPGWGPFHYELSVVAGDPGEEGTERDAWKDVFGRLSYIFNYNTDKEIRVGAFGYRGRSEIVSNFGGVELAQRDKFWMGGGDLELDVGKVNLSLMGYYSRHNDALPQGGRVDFMAGRATALWSPAKRWVLSARLEAVYSGDLHDLESYQLAPHVTYQFAENALATLVWRQDLVTPSESSGVFVLDASF